MRTTQNDSIPPVGRRERVGEFVLLLLLVAAHGSVSRPANGAMRRPDLAPRDLQADGQTIWTKAEKSVMR